MVNLTINAISKVFNVPVSQNTTLKDLKFLIIKKASFIDEDAMTLIFNGKPITCRNDDTLLSCNIIDTTDKVVVSDGIGSGVIFVTMGPVGFFADDIMKAGSRKKSKGIKGRKNKKSRKSRKSRR